MIQREDINILLADTYYESAKTLGVDMRKVTELLETLRPHFTDQPVFDIWKHIRLDSIDLENENLIRILTKLKYDYFNLVYKAGIQHIQQITAQDPESGFQAWLHIYAEAIIHWESHVYDRIDDVPFDFSDSHRQYLKDAQKFHDYVRDNRWADCYERYKSLAENEQLKPLQQALLHTIAGQIQLYYYLDMEHSRTHLETARKLSPLPNAKIERCFGEWHLKNQEFDTARMFFMNAMSIDINDADAYLAMGDSYRDERKWSLAAEYYSKAIAINPLETSPYDRLLYIYGEPDMIGENEPKLALMLQKIELLNFNTPDKRYSNWRYNGYRAMGWVYYRNENYPKAIEWYTKAVKLQPSWSSAYIDLGNTYYSAGDKPAAKKQYDKAESVAPDSYDAFWVLAWYYEQEKAYETAISYYSKCIALRPASAKDTGFIIANIYSEHLQFFPKALDCLQQLISQYPNNEKVYEKTAAIYAKSGDMPAAETAWRKVLDINPHNHNAWNETGVIQYKQAAYQEAAISFEKALAINPGDPVYYGNLSDAYRNAGEGKKSEQILRNGIAQFPKNADLLNKMGNIHFDRREYEKAREFYQQSVEIQPDNTVFNTNVAGAYKMLQDWNNAARYYENALRLSPDNDDYLNESGIIAFRMGQYQQSVDYFEQAAIASPETATYFDNLGQALLQVPGKEKETETAFLQALSLSPDNDVFQNRTGNFYLLHGRYQEALDCYQIATELQPDNAIYIANAGYARLYLGQLTAAVLDLEKAIELDPDMTQAHIWLAAVFAAQGDRQKGANYLVGQMTHSDNPEYLLAFLEIFDKLEKPDPVFTQMAVEKMQQQPLIWAKYQQLVSEGP
jgi:tetratricopeptide (TPR) repeat protein